MPKKKWVTNGKINPNIVFVEADCIEPSVPLGNVADVNKDYSTKLISKKIVAHGDVGLVVTNKAADSYGNLIEASYEPVGEKKRVVGLKGDLCFDVRSESNIYLCNKEICLMNNDFITIRPKKGIIPEYLIVLIKSGILKDKIDAIRSGTNIGKKGLSKLHIPVPALEIQEKIAATWRKEAEKEQELTRLREDLEEELIKIESELTGNVRSASGQYRSFAYLNSTELIERMDPQYHLKTHHIDQNNRSNITQLRGIATVYSGCRINSDDWVNNGIPVLSNKNFESYIITREPLGAVSESYVKQHHRSCAVKGELIMCILGRFALGKTALAEDTYYLSQSLARISCDNNKVYPPFLAAYLNTPALKQTLVQKLRGANQKYLTVEDIGSLPICMPNYDKQVQLAKRYLDCITFLKKTALNVPSGIETSKHLVNTYLVK